MKRPTTHYNLPATRAFTFIELLIVIAIIGILVTLGLVSLTNVQGRARDAQRLSDMKDIQTALEEYKIDNGVYPTNTDKPDCLGFDAGRYDGPRGTDPFIKPLIDEGYLKKVPADPKFIGCEAYEYYRYDAGEYGCDLAKGPFYVLKVSTFESVTGTHPASPGWICPGRNWYENEGDQWVTGSYE